MITFRGTVTRNSNGTIELRPFDDANPSRELAMGSEVEANFDVLRTVDEIEEANARSKNRPAPQPAPTSTPATSTAPANPTAVTSTAGGRKTTSRTQTTG